jgi:hypothetical protein
MSAIQTERILSDADIQEIHKATPELAKLGLIVEGAGNPDVNYNAEAIFGYFNRHPEVPVTAAAILSLVHAGTVDAFKWVSPTAKKHFLVMAGLDQSAKDILQAFFERGKGRYLTCDGVQGMENDLVLIDYCQKIGGITWESLSRAFDALNPAFGFESSPLNFKEETKPEHSFENRTGLVNHAENYKPEDKKEPTREFVHGRRNHAYKDPNAPAPVQVDPDEGGGWKKVCEVLARDGSHADQAALSEVMNRAHASGKSWKETYYDMQAEQRARADYRVRN